MTKSSLNSQANADKWWPDAIVLPSPNCDQRPRGETLDAIILHSISLPPGDYPEMGDDELVDHPVVAFFQNCLNPKDHVYFQGIHTMRVSSHFFITRGGQLVQFVPLELRAWHAGESYCQARTGVNDFSVGIELEGLDVGSDGYSVAQYERLANLLAGLMKVYPRLGRHTVFSHSDIALGRKLDPGPKFDWSRLWDGVDAALL